MRFAIVMLTICVSAIAAQDATKPADPSRTDADKVRILIRQLDADNRADRDAATDALVKFGPEVLKHIPPLDDKGLSAEQRQRLRRIMPRLWQSRLDADISGRMVDLGGKPMPLLDAVKKISADSGNRVVDMREQFNQEVTNPEISVGKKFFWQSLDSIAMQAKASCYFATEDRSIGLVGRPKKFGPLSYAGAFRFELQRLVLERPFDDAKTADPFAMVKFEVLFEPRLRPVVVEVDSSSITATDDKGRTISYSGQKDISFPLERDGYAFPLTVKLESPKRDAVKLTKLAGQIYVSMPIHIERFEFAELEIDKPAEKTSPGVRVVLNRLGVQEGTWTASMTFETLAEGGGKVESHIRSAMELEVYLEQKSDGKRFKQNGGLNTVADEPGKTSIDYLFVDAPGKPKDYRLVVNAPTGIGRVPVKFSFENIPLP